MTTAVLQMREWRRGVMAKTTRSSVMAGIANWVESRIEKTANVPAFGQNCIGIASAPVQAGKILRRVDVGLPFFHLHLRNLGKIFLQ
jgi:hypothetical protein